MAQDFTRFKDGPAIASILSGAFGCALIGLATVLAEAIPAVKEALTWWAPAGPLSGETGLGVLGWLFSWIFLHLLLRRKELSFVRYWTWALGLIGIGMLGTLPPFFELFAAH